ncbi:DUF805 domain-containing protein [Caulobacter endophyticus]|uniref:DUF805 domain-containing protein n=1 Tax=Caulobacter endophyticus TaxID=2172652 RepID=UPI0024104FEB|nr:DUF805 domain-containing protein [Caulobacter endophyticus]MDG2527536.1 DUF805 domain-containing protein [Caulobacter endophyticus]
MILRYLRGRARRLEFWLGFVVVMALLYKLPDLLETSLGVPAMWLLLAVWLLVSSRRLRDIGWPTWLSLEPVVSQVGTAIVKITPFGAAHRETLDGPVNTVTLVAWLLFVLVLGVWKSKPTPVLDPERQAEVFG